MLQGNNFVKDFFYFIKLYLILLFISFGSMSQYGGISYHLNDSVVFVGWHLALFLLVTFSGKWSVMRTRELPIIPHTGFCLNSFGETILDMLQWSMEIRFFMKEVRISKIFTTVYFVSYYFKHLNFLQMNWPKQKT